MKVHVLVPAAGIGRRFGPGMKKQYLELGGRPILAHTLARLAKLIEVNTIHIIVPKEEIPFCRDAIVKEFALSKVANIISGGKERQDSVFNGLMACAAANDDLVLIHDGVRPFFPTGQIAPLLAAAETVGAALLATPAQDTIKRVQDGRVERTLDRNVIWQAQTPQAFRYELILAAHQRAHENRHYGTDDASLVEWCGWPVAVVPGASHNFKITTPADLGLARALLATGEMELI